MFLTEFLEKRVVRLTSCLLNWSSTCSTVCLLLRLWLQRLIRNKSSSLKTLSKANSHSSQMTAFHQNANAPDLTTQKNLRNLSRQKLNKLSKDPKSLQLAKIRRRTRKASKASQSKHQLKHQLNLRTLLTFCFHLKFSLDKRNQRSSSFKSCSLSPSSQLASLD